MSILPPHITSDAVPDKRTADEENQPPTVQQAQDYVRRHNERVPEDSACGPNNETVESNSPNAASTSSERPKKPTGPDSKEKAKKKKRSCNATSIVNISHSSGFQLCNNTYISNNWVTNGMVPSMLHKSNSPNFNSMHGQQTHLPIPENIFRCLEKVTDEDCTIVSEYVACGWKTLGEQLFRDNLNHLSEFVSQIEGKSNKEAILMILKRWKQVNWKLADVRQLCLALQKLNEIKAIMKVAKSHEIK